MLYYLASRNYAHTKCISYVNCYSLHTDKKVSQNTNNVQMTL